MAIEIYRIKERNGEQLNPTTSKMKFRLNTIILFCIFGFSVWVIMNLCNASIIKASEYQQLANETQFSAITIPANRGGIYDRNGETLAQSATVYKVFVDPSLFKKYDEDKEDKVVSILVEKLGVDKDTVLKKIHNTASKYEIVATQVEKPLADSIAAYVAENEIKSIHNEEDTRRFYPQNELAASVIGFTNVDGGQYGIEKQYDQYLKGIDGKVISATDGLGDEMPYQYTKLFEAQNGNDLTLTLDMNLQYMLEKHLNESYVTHQLAERACGIMMNPKTGEIYAMATTPGFDLNKPSEIYDKATADYLDTLSEDEYKEEYVREREIQWKNKAITELYYPGSVFKVITGSSALDAKAIALEDTYSCNGGCNVSGVHIRCWKAGGHGTQDFVQAITNSCNPAFVEIGRRLGAESFFGYFRSFGFTEMTEIDLPNEAAHSIYQGLEGMGPVELASCSFGQTNKITPIQMITAYAAVVNGGNLLTPYVVDKVTDKYGNTMLDNKTEVKRQVISEETSATMRMALEAIVNTNGGTNAYIKGYKIGGKSGTSQKQDKNNELGVDDLYVSSYVCFAPADDPEVILLVMADEPTTGEYYGSVVAVPYARAILTEALPYLGFYPEYTDDEIATLDVSVPDFTNKIIENATATIEDLKLNYEVIGDGERVLRQVPSAGDSIRAGGKVILYTDDSEELTTVVPNLVGKTYTQINELLTNAELNYVSMGSSPTNESSVVLQQSHYAGAEVKKGTIITVTFGIKDQSG